MPWKCIITRKSIALTFLAGSQAARACKSLRVIFEILIQFCFMLIHFLPIIIDNFYCKKTNFPRHQAYYTKHVSPVNKAGSLELFHGWNMTSWVFLSDTYSAGSLPAKSFPCVTDRSVRVSAGAARLDTSRECRELLHRSRSAAYDGQWEIIERNRYTKKQKNYT